MKNIFKIIAVVVLVFGFSALHAQVKDTTKKVTATTGKAASALPAEYVFIRNGIVLKHKAGYDTGLSAAYICTDGSKIVPDRTLTRKDGTVIKLKEGDIVYKDGTVVPASKK